MKKEKRGERTRAQKTIYCVSPCIGNVQNRYSRRDRKQMGGCQGLGEGRTASDCPGVRDFTQGDRNVLELDSDYGGMTP